MKTKRPYRFVLRAYPPHHRRRHGDELIETALAMHDDRWSPRQALSFVANGARASLAEPRRWWGLAVLFPVLLAAGQMADLVAHSQAELPSWHGWLGSALWPAKWATIPSLPILVVLLAEKVAERPARWRAAVGVWSVLGLGLVLMVSTRIESISATVSNAASWRLWPTNLSDGAERSLEASGGFGSSWTPTQIVARELIAVVAVAAASGLAVRRCARDGVPVLAGGAVPLAVALTLVAYKLIAPWSFRSDFDFFVGDVVLGSTIGELLFFPAPFDPIGSLAIGLAGLSMGGLIAAWGGVAPGSNRRPVRRPNAVAAPLPGERSGS